MTFPEHLIKLRENRGVSQKALAKALDIGLHTYQRYEYGERTPPLPTLIALADFYDISLDELVCRDWPKKPAS